MNQVNLEIINQFVLQKQHLTNDTKINDIIQIASDIGGLHATNKMTAYLSLFARVNNFSRYQLDKELYENKRLGKIRFVRKTMYLLPTEKIPEAYSATKDLIQKIVTRYVQGWGISKNQFDKVSKSILKLLNGRGMTTKEIKSALKSELNISAILNLMCDQGQLTRVTSQKSWKSNIHTYYLFNEYYPELDLDSVKEDKAKLSVVKQYLASFGPVTVNDAAWWTGFTKREINKNLDSFSELLTEIEISNLNGEYLILNTDLKSIQTQKTNKKFTLNFLPSLDPYVMGYKDRERYLENKNYYYIFDRSGNAANTILLNGKIIGIWDVAETPRAIVKIFLFDEVEKQVELEIRQTAKKIGKFILGHDVKIKECDSMVPLNKRTAGSVMTPLKDCR